MIRYLRLAIWITLISPTFFARAAEPVALESRSFTLGPLLIDRPYLSMTGPVAERTIDFGRESQSPFLWIKSFRVDITNVAGNPESFEFLCHAWASFAGFGQKTEGLLTVSQGMPEMRFPEGFALKISNVPQNLKLLAQALNNGEKTHKELNYHLSLSFLNDDAARKAGWRELRGVTFPVLARDQDRTGAPTSPHHHHMVNDVELTDPMHFSVPVGRHEFRSPIPAQALPTGDVRIHSIKMHLHPYGMSVALFDKTANRTLWTGYAQNAKDRAAILKVDSYTDRAGFSLPADHLYEVVAVYDNTSAKTVDGMGVLRAYWATAPSK